MKTAKLVNLCEVSIWRASPKSWRFISAYCPSNGTVEAPSMCGDWCPFCEIVQKDDTLTAVLSCRSQTKTIEIE